MLESREPWKGHFGVVAVLREDVYGDVSGKTHDGWGGTDIGCLVWCLLIEMFLTPHHFNFLY